MFETNSGKSLYSSSIPFLGPIAVPMELGQYSAYRFRICQGSHAGMVVQSRGATVHRPVLGLPWSDPGKISKGPISLSL